MNIKRFETGEFGTNSYLIYKGKEGILIDAGFEIEEVEEYISKKEINLKGLFLTHTHLDHIGGVEKIRNRFHAPLYVHEKEKDWLSNPRLNGSEAFPHFGLVKVKPAEHYIETDKIIEMDEWKIRVIQTPGHTPGGISFYIKPWLFSGDSLFFRSIGRTDLYGGNMNQLVQSIKNKLFTLPNETVVYPGHGEKTSIRDEKLNNPFL